MPNGIGKLDAVTRLKTFVKGHEIFCRLELSKESRQFQVQSNRQNSGRTGVSLKKADLEATKPFDPCKVAPDTLSTAHLRKCPKCLHGFVNSVLTADEFRAASTKADTEYKEKLSTWENTAPGLRAKKPSLKLTKQLWACKCSMMNCLMQQSAGTCPACKDHPNRQVLNEKDPSYPSQDRCGCVYCKCNCTETFDAPQYACRLRQHMESREISEIAKAGQSEIEIFEHQINIALERSQENVIGRGDKGAAAVDYLRNNGALSGAAQHEFRQRIDKPNPFINGQHVLQMDTSHQRINGFAPPQYGHNDNGHYVGHRHNRNGLQRIQAVPSHQHNSNFGERDYDGHDTSVWQDYRDFENPQTSTSSSSSSYFKLNISTMNEVTIEPDHVSYNIINGIHKIVGIMYQMEPRS